MVVGTFRLFFMVFGLITEIHEGIFIIINISILFDRNLKNLSTRDPKPVIYPLNNVEKVEL